MPFHGYREPIAVPSTSGPRPDPRQNATIQELTDNLERQRLLVQTLCRILIEKGVIEKDELDEWLKYMDGLDGAVDGKLRESKAPKECPNCHRNNPPRAPKCVYCGEELPTAVLEPDPNMEKK